MASGPDQASSLPRSFWEGFLHVEPRSTRRYAAAIILAVASLLGIYAANQLGAANFSSFAMAAVVLSAIYGGKGPAMLCTAATAIGIDYLIAEPVFEVFDSWTSVLRVLTYGIVGYLVADLVSSLREAYRRVREEHRKATLAIEARDKVLAMVSHDLRAPLSSILLHANFLWRALVHGEPAGDLRSGLQNIHRSAQRMNRLIEDLLDAVRIEAGRFRIEQRVGELVALIEDAVEGTRSAAEAKGIRLNLELPDTHLRLRCDRDRLTQALTNLLNNAVKFSPEGAPVEVKLDSSGEWITVSIRDWGGGIAEEHLGQLFRPYWQAMDTAHLGTGLGLYISKSIVDAHSGRIEVRSAKGHGTTFSVLLPKAALAA